MTGRALVFIGFMGAGKSMAAAAAREAGLAVLDTDELLERELGSTIGEFFDRHGEAEFRRREEALAGELLERADGEAIALGGGSVLSERVRDALERHVVVWLRVGAAQAWGRVDASRPLARDRARFESLFSEREPVYERLADTIVPVADPGVVDRAMPALLALRELPAGVRMAWATSASGEYPAFVGRGLLEMSPLGRVARYGDIGIGGRAFCVTDPTVGPLYAELLEPLAARIEVPAGERAKTLAEAERVLRELARLGATRSDHLLALGGGVVGDLAGFCAATYQRGVAVIQVPTTLVAQVDSAYGGKTAVDLPEAKNYVGAYHLPRAVLADPATLATLPAGELAAGFAEVVKTALIRGGALWERVRAVEAPLEPGELDEVIFACALTKLEVVAADERDSDRRAALNLGHTVGHAIEAAAGYGRYRHGEAVGLGLLAALRLSDAGGLREEVESILARHGLPLSFDPETSVEEVLAGLERDKKRTARGVGYFVLCPRPGDVRTAQAVDADRVRAAVEELRRPAEGAR